ncbi:MAG: hypothetical protein Kow0047_16370 [Anaerolineae bacterium]
MRLEDFPRPKDDNGRGVHWSANQYHPKGSELDFWINELVEMKIKWVKLLDDGGGSSQELCERLLDADIMPIVRLYRKEPNPGHIGGREEETIRRLVKLGVRYFETNNEPDLPAEWSTHMPDNWLEIVVDNFIYDADRVLDAGGLLALPAMGPGSKDNPIELIVRKGRGDLFERGCWVAIHNYTLNHPLDYPEDDVSRYGKPLTREEYEYFGSWAWDGRPIEMINRLRAERKNPDITVYDDPNCFRGYLWTARMIEEALGFMVPIISTEGGPVVGWGDDKRYPKVIPSQHAEWQVEICRFFQEEAPDYYFTCCTWLLASRGLGDFSPTWDQMSWYTHAWDQRFGLNGRLPVVQALKELPSVSRLWPRGESTLEGNVLREDTHQPLQRFPVVLRPLGKKVRRREVRSDEQGRYEFDQLSSGQYELETARGALVQQIEIGESGTVQHDLIVPPGAYSRLTGRVVDTQGLRLGNTPVRLRTLFGDEVASVRTDREGRYVMEHLPAGTFRLEAAEGDQQVRIDGVTLDGYEEKTIDITVPAPVGYVYAVVSKRLLPPEETGNRNLIYGRVLDPSGNGINGIELEMRWVGASVDTVFPRTRTGRDPFKPVGTYEFLHTPGEFMVQVVQGDWESEVAEGLKTTGIPGRNRPITWEVNFQLRPLSLGQNSAIRGRMEGASEGTRVFLVEEKSGQRWTTIVGADGRFVFTDLGRGHYQLSVEGIGVIRDKMNLDGKNEVEVLFPMRGVIQGVVRNAPLGAQVTLRPLVPGWEWTRVASVTAEGTYRFIQLPAAPYEIELDPEHKVQTVCDGNGVFTAPTIVGEAVARSVIRGQVMNAAGDPAVDVAVELWLSGQKVAKATTNDEGFFSFSGLGAGSYEVVVPGMDLRRSVAVDGLSEATVLLRPEAEVAESVLTGQIQAADGSPVAGQEVELRRDGARVAVAVTDADGRYVFQDLPAGVYQVLWSGAVIHRDVILDGRNRLELSYRLPEPDQKVLDLYLWLGQPAEDAWVIMALAQPYLAAATASAGFSLKEARRARRVLILGDERQVSAEDEQALKDAGCDVQRISGDLYALEQALNALAQGNA